MKKHVIFDFDDTLSSSYKLNQQLFVDTFTPYKSDIDQDFICKLHYKKRGTAMILQFQEVIDKFKLDITADKLVEENEVLHQKRATDMKIFNGIENILKHFKKLGKTISICTNRQEGSLKIILEKYNLYQYFDNVISCADAGHQKPDAFCLVELLGKYPSISKNECIYFGDSKTDAEFATNAGIDFIVIDHYLNKEFFYEMILNSFAGSEDELLIEVDKDDKDIGAVYKMEAHTNPNRYHRAAHIVLFNSKGQIILQQRSQQKAYDPGAWDIPGGHQTFGQSIEQTAQIELMEEMGIGGNLKFVRNGLKQDGKQSEYYYLYYTVNDGPYCSNPQEVQSISEFDCQKLLDHQYDDKFMILEHVYRYVEELMDVWTRLQTS